MFFVFAPLRGFEFDQTLTQNVSQIILFYHVTKQLRSYLNWFITCFRFQNMLRKNITCFRFWWKTYKKCYTNNYVTYRVKRLCSPAFYGWSGAFNFWIWFGKMEECRVSKNNELKYGGKNSDFYFVQLLFTLLTLF